jgi:hypothetical protein
LDRNPRRRPAADDVAHRQQPDHVLPLGDHEVAEAAPHHRRRGRLHRPVPPGEDQVLRAVLVGDLFVGVLPGRDRHEDVPLGQDADPGVIRVHHDRGSDLAGGHHAGRLT